VIALLAVAAAVAGEVDAPVHTGQESPHDYAVVVGVEDYAFLPDVPHAAADAAAVQTWLRASRGVPDHRIERLVDASREQILAALERAAAAVGDEGTLWLFWAGHGAASATTGERLLLGVDVMADPSVFEARAVRSSELDALFARVPHAVWWADTCYAGVGRDGAPILPGARFAVPTYAAPTGSSVLRWTAAGPGELSQALPAEGHGAFTWASLRAVRGEADGELDGQRDGSVSAAEAQAFVQRALASAGVRAQTPQLEGDRSFSFAHGLPEVAPLASAPAPLQPIPPRPVAPAPPPAPDPGSGRDGRRTAALVLGGAAVGALGTALVTRTIYVNAGPEQGSLDGLVTVNRVAGYGGLGLAAGALSLGVSARW
jgi:hypothetical protein